MFIVSTRLRLNMISEAENSDIHQSYQKIVKERERLETENYMLQEEVKRLMKYSPAVGSVIHSRSVSNVSSVNLEEDFGYSSAKNTLEIKKERPDRNNVSVDFNHTPENFVELRKL